MVSGATAWYSSDHRIEFGHLGFGTAMFIPPASLFIFITVSINRGDDLCIDTVLSVEYRTPF